MYSYEFNKNYICLGLEWLKICDFVFHNHILGSRDVRMFILINGKSVQNQHATKFLGLFIM